MDYQHYNDPSLMTFNTYNEQEYPSHSPTDLNATSHWSLMSSSHHTPNTHMNMDGEESISQPERGVAGFVSKLYQCLQAPDNGQKYARWCKHNGTDMFIIDCIPKFTEIVLPQLFKHCKFASFVRQLNIYGFQRDTDARKSKDSKDKETCRWHHVYFRPSRTDLHHLIRRKTPRYSRKKKPRTEEEEVDDPETILNVGSGDESDVNHDDYDSANNSLDERRRSASSASSSSLTLQLQQYNRQTMSTATATTPTDMLFDTNPQHMYPPLFNTATTSPISTLEDASVYCQQQQHHQTFAPTFSHLPHFLEQAIPNDEEQLKSQIIELRHNYIDMYKMLTGEVQKAFDLIDVQRSKIVFLEGLLRQQQQQQIRIDTSSYPYNPILHTAPTTPIYHSSMAATASTSASAAQNHNFLFPTHKDESTNSPATTLPDKWIAPSYH
ncbi:HSF-type DNA-binding-domain-containing protein [Parasitella parasitica]|nr:HSF-type DNA-binding-domain-containing protein [Parasitella parasitica]